MLHSGICSSLGLKTALMIREILIYSSPCILGASLTKRKWTCESKHMLSLLLPYCQCLYSSSATSSNANNCSNTFVSKNHTMHTNDQFWRIIVVSWQVNYMWKLFMELLSMVCDRMVFELINILLSIWF